LSILVHEGLFWKEVVAAPEREVLLT
jgi:hypothetical protein